MWRSVLNEQAWFYQSGRKRDISESELKDRYGLAVFVGGSYFKGKYLKRIFSRNNLTLKFKLPLNSVFIEPDEVYQKFDIFSIIILFHILVNCRIILHKQCPFMCCINIYEPLYYLLVPSLPFSWCIIFVQIRDTLDKPIL